MASTTSANPSTLATSSTTPTGTIDSAPGSPSNPETAPSNTSNNNDNDNDDQGVNGGMASYYFVFLMLTLCVIGIVLFLNFRRRRKRRLQMLYGRDGGDDGTTRTTHWAYVGQEQGRRRYWPGGRWGSANVSREEGLNEQGEAPPPYVPKASDGTAEANNGMSVPMQTLSRDDAGLRPPPGYDEAGTSSSGAAERR